MTGISQRVHSLRGLFYFTKIAIVIIFIVLTELYPSLNPTFFSTQWFVFSVSFFFFFAIDYVPFAYKGAKHAWKRMTKMEEV